MTLLIASAMCSLFTNSVNAAPRTAIRGSGAARQQAAPVATTTVTESQITTEEIVFEPEPVIENVSTPAVNKSTKFAAVAKSGSNTSSSGNKEMAELIRQQRNALNAKDAANVAETVMKNALLGLNTCDKGLRECMQKQCGEYFTGCALDGDADFGAKITKCTRDLKCTGEEVRLFSTEIKADRDLYVQIASYQSVIDCANAYNDCMISECGLTFDNCLGKKAENAALNKCKQIADRCKEQDSGLPGRVGKVIAGLRENAEENIAKDEQRLRDLRESIKSACETLGTKFDERSFRCLYTVDFFAGEDNPNVPKASRHLYAGSKFKCQQEFFGIDVTTYRENALRETRAQTGASSAMLGSGLGVAAGAIASGAIGRAIDTEKAEGEVKDKEKKLACEQAKKWWVEKEQKCVNPNSDCSVGVAGSSKGTGKWKQQGTNTYCYVEKCNNKGWAPSIDHRECAFLKKNQDPDGNTK